MTFGILLVVVVFAFPDGLMGTITRLRDRTTPPRAEVAARWRWTRDIENALSARAILYPMLTRRLRARHLHSAVAIVLALLGALSPLGDALAFGLHDHIAGAKSGASSQWSTQDDLLKPAHHCELSMSPIGLALAPEIPLLRSSTPVVPDPSMPAPLSELPVQLSPPRA